AKESLADEKNLSALLFRFEQCKTLEEIQDEVRKAKIRLKGEHYEEFRMALADWLWNTTITKFKTRDPAKHKLDLLEKLWQRFALRTKNIRVISLFSLTHNFFFSVYFCYELTYCRHYAGFVAYQSISLSKPHTTMSEIRCCRLGQHYGFKTTVKDACPQLIGSDTEKDTRCILHTPVSETLLTFR
ncbi:MAG: hypothetical protein IJU76_15880, partial [Desulfovibrionaceae bacterium]|nr:hypothetical protein [Desulfovibrionaceae bacterium]